MATLKHIASKNSDYTAIEAYLVYQHDEFSGKVILDKQGRPMLRESYILDTLECGGFSFATACLLANRKYGKNTQRDDIKSHQYIQRHWKCWNLPALNLSLKKRNPFPCPHHKQKNSGAIMCRTSL